MARIQGVLAASTADETEITWVESRTAEATTSKRRPGRPLRHHRWVSVRVLEGRRTGSLQTGSGDRLSLEEAVRLAVAHSRANAPLEAPRKLPNQGAAFSAGEELFDPEVADLTPSSAQRFLLGLIEKGERAHLAWSECLVVVANSRGLVQQARLTGAAVNARSGRGFAAGTAGGAARTLAALDARGIVERARRRAGGGAGGEAKDAESDPLPARPHALLLAPEAICDLVALLDHLALSAEAFRRGQIFSSEHLEQEVFSPLLTFRDDGNDLQGLPLPFDLAGWPKRPVDLILQGVLASPALDPGLGRELGRTPTPHFLAPDETRPTHLFLQPGASSQEELLAAADGGLWIPRLDALSPQLPGSDELRATARGARPITAGTLGPPLTPLLWEDRLTRLFREVLALGTETVTRPLGEEMLGGVTAPALAVAPGGSLRPVA